MAKQKKLKCSKCDRRFSMPAHLARHMNTTHEGGKRKVGMTRKGRKPGRRPGRPTGKRTGLALAGLSLTELCRMIEMARSEAMRRIEAT